MPKFPIICFARPHFVVRLTLFHTTANSYLPQPTRIAAWLPGCLAVSVTLMERDQMLAQFTEGKRLRSEDPRMHEIETLMGVSEDELLKLQCVLLPGLCAVMQIGRWSCAPYFIAPNLSLLS